MNRQSFAAALALGAALFVAIPTAHADDDAGYAALGFFLGNVVAGPRVVYSAPRVVVTPPPRAYRYYAPPPGYYYYTPPPQVYAYPSYRAYYRGGWDDDDDHPWRRNEWREHRWHDDD